MTKHVAEKSKVDKLYDILNESKKPKTFYELADHIFTREDIEADKGEALARLYTTLTLDGRFLSIGDNFWALRSWFPLEQREEDVAKTIAPNRKKKLAEDGFDDYDDVDDEEIDELDEDYVSEDDEDGDEDENEGEESVDEEGEDPFAEDFDDDSQDDDAVQLIKNNLSTKDDEE
ncbi:DNA-directed RNA polymerase subunit delta [Terrilactibacillus sp. S3-3]|nr:DNA-directed RNA polymerase subunit delta [Terrilactibacillus sp. S3-3]